jgi:G-protein signaling modulator 2
VGLAGCHKSASGMLNENNIIPYKMIDDGDDNLSFLDTLSKIQSDRLDDQRCSIKVKPAASVYTPYKAESASKSLKESTNVEKSGKKAHHHHGETLNDDFFNMLMKTQGSRLEDQRSSPALQKSEFAKPPVAPLVAAAAPPKKTAKNQASTIPPDDSFFSMLQKVQSRRLDEQRSSLKFSSIAASLKNATSSVVKSVSSNEKPLRN